MPPAPLVEAKTLIAIRRLLGAQRRVIPPLAVCDSTLACDAAPFDMFRDWPLIATMDEEHAPDCIVHEEEATAAADRRAIVIALPGELSRRLITTPA